MQARIAIVICLVAIGVQSRSLKKELASQQEKTGGGGSKSVSWGSGTESPGVWVFTRPGKAAKNQ